MSPKTQLRQLDRFGVRITSDSIDPPCVMLRITRRTLTSAHWEVWWLVHHRHMSTSGRMLKSYYALDSLAASGIAPSFWQCRLHASQAVRRLHFKEYS